jgi:hypothetical protein
VRKFQGASIPTSSGKTTMAGSERKRELRRRRKRRIQMTKIRRRLVKATASEKQAVAGKIRKMTPGAKDVLNNFGLIEKK